MPATSVSSLAPALGRRTVVLTGGTGFVGVEVLARLLERTSHDIVALVRAQDAAAATARMRAVLEDALGDAGRGAAARVEAIAADLERPALGLSPIRHTELAERATDIVHCGASVSFSMPLPESRAINLAGTARVLDLAREAQRRGGLRRLVHVSTAYVAGEREGVVYEHELSEQTPFRNAYERSKHEAERLVHDAALELPVRIARPSIIVGERATGWTAAFNVLYWPLRAFSRGLYPVIPAEQASPVDIVPVDYVADGIHALLEDEVVTRDGDALHLTAGASATNVAELVELACRRFERRRPDIVSPERFATEIAPVVEAEGSSAQRQALAQSEVYFPYFAMRMRFDDRRARALLAPSGVEAPPLASYFDRLMDYATAARWGKRPLSRAAVLAGAAGVAAAA